MMDTDIVYAVVSTVAYETFRELHAVFSTREKAGAYLSSPDNGIYGCGEVETMKLDDPDFEAE